MVGPSDSFTHATQKLSEAGRAAIAGLQNMSVPPPAYTANPPVETEDTDSNIEDNAEDWKGPPVTIHIDASISIEGTGNQIALPPHPSSRPLRIVGETLRAAQGVPSDYLGSPSLSSSVLANVTGDRAEQITDAVMQALKDSGVLVGTATPQRALEVHVDASMRFKGERNMLTTNAPLRRNVSGASASQTDTPSPLHVTRGVGNVEAGTGSESGSGSGNPDEGGPPSDAGRGEAQVPVLVDARAFEDSTADAGSEEAT